MTTVYELQEQIRKKERPYTRLLDRYLEDKFGLRLEKHESDEVDKDGIDRWAVLRNGDRVSLQYKCDHKAAATKKLAIELLHIGAQRHWWGWSIDKETDRAEWLLVYVPPLGRVFWLRTSRVRAKLRGWMRKYGISRKWYADNGDYDSWNICVPFEEIATVCGKITDDETLKVVA